MADKCHKLESFNIDYIYTRFKMKLLHSIIQGMPILLYFLILHVFYKVKFEWVWLFSSLSYTPLGLEVMVFNANFNNSSAIASRSVLLVEEIGVPWKNLRPAASHWQTL